MLEGEDKAWIRRSDVCWKEISFNLWAIFQCRSVVRKLVAHSLRELDGGLWAWASRAQRLGWHSAGMWPGDLVN